MKNQLYFFVLVLFLLCFKANAQVEVENPTSDFIYEGNYFIPGSPWLIVGTGYGKNFSENRAEPNFLVDLHYQFEKKKQCVGFGYLTSRDQFRDIETGSMFLPQSYVRHTTNSLHGTYGIRFERMRHNFAMFAGPAYNWGYRYAYTDSVGRDWHTQYSELGLYANVEYSFKIFYDVGVGASVWGSACNSYKVVGFTIHVYFSSAFKRSVI